MDREDAKKVVQDLTSKPFTITDNVIETDSGYVIMKLSDYEELNKNIGE